ncbi:hypothetical protein [Paraburkholderia hiiakae]|uniref:hypothetical protein n=1 Tax=Paraburkholderia hiiakae TaxID=1081782 RepID=UPI00191A01FE|nr:hypothetical protein [Paraburkholderia hiiakae]
MKRFGEAAPDWSLHRLMSADRPRSDKNCIALGLEGGVLRESARSKPTTVSTLFALAKKGSNTTGLFSSL